MARHTLSGTLCGFILENAALPHSLAGPLVLSRKSWKRMLASVLRGELNEEFNMKEKAWSRGFWLVFSVVGFASSANLALADKTADVVVQADNSTMTVTRVAPRSPVHMVSLGRPVFYGNIDLNSPSADQELQKRISNAAGDVCRRLDERFPDSEPRGRACVAIAVKNALQKVHDSEMAAQRKANN